MRLRFQIIIFQLSAEVPETSMPPWEMGKGARPLFLASIIGG
jgi:hypothetical protein